MQKLLMLCLTVARVLRRSDFSPSILQLRKTTSAPCMVLGTGPSLTGSLQKNNELVKQCVAFSVNSFARSSLYEQLKPKFHIIADPAYNHKDAAKDDFEYFKNDALILAEKTDWDLDILMPSYAKPWNHFQECAGKKKNIRLHYYNSIVPQGPAKSVFRLYDRGLACPSFHNVTAAALFFALFIGFKTIYLAGADHSWHKNIMVGDDNKLYRVLEHCYKESGHWQGKIPILHNIVSGHRPNIAEYFQKASLTFQSYYEIRDYAAYKNSIITNISPDSFIDAFERIKV
jgi:hypothetical protein